MSNFGFGDKEPTPAVVEAAANLIADVKSRYPGEALRCPHMIALDAALSTHQPQTDAGEAVREAVHIVFDGPPGPQSGRFIEVETPDGRSVGVGEWRERENGWWELIIPNVLPAEGESA